MPQKPSAAERLQDLAKTITYHQEQADQHNAAAAAAEAELRQILGTYTKGVKAGSLTIDWNKPRSTFLANEFVAAYPPDTNRHMYKLVPDGDAIPKNLKDRFMKEGSGTGTVKIK